MYAVELFFLILALVLFIIAGLRLTAMRRVDLIAFGLAAWVLAELLPRIIGGA